MPNTSTATVTTAHSCSSSKTKRTARCAVNPDAAASNVVQFDRLAGAARQRIADAQTLRRAQAAKALEEVKKHVAEAIRLLEPFKCAISIAPTVCGLSMCAKSTVHAFEDLDTIGLVTSEVLRDKAVSVEPSTHDALAVRESADVLALVGVQHEGGAQ